MKSKDDIQQKLSEKFQDYEAVPQDDSWAKIRFGLDLKEKFSFYEVEPQDNSWDKIQLSTELSEKFRAYEAEPQAESWTKIKAAIEPEKKSRLVIFPFFYRAGIAASIALLLGFGWLLSRSKQDGTSNVTLNKNAQKSAGESHNQQFGSSKNSVDKPNTQINTSPKSNFEEKLAENRKFVPNKIKGRNENIDKLLKKETFAQNKAKIKSLKEETNLPIRVEHNKNGGENVIAENQKIVIPEIESNDKSLTFNILSSKSFKERFIRKPFGAIAYNNERPMLEQEERVRRKLILTTSLMPLQAYQALTILPQTNNYIQQVGTLNAFDAQRLGIQLRIGAMKPLSNRFSTGASFTYSGIQQRVSYEVNKGEYEIQTTDNQTYTLVGLGTSVNQSAFLQTVGLKIDNSFLLSKKKNEVYILGGGEAVRVLNDNEYAYYLNASVGVSYPTKNGKSIWIEPTFRYSLSQSLDANNYLQIRPYNIGLNVRVNFM